MNDTLSISIVTKEDIPAITRVVNSAYHGLPGSKSWTSESHLIAGQRTNETLLLDLFLQPGVTLLKCSNAQEEVIGSVLLEEKQNTLYLGMLSVAPQAQTAGIGKLLLLEGEAFAREHRYQSITITVINLRHELVEWYKRRGYNPTGKTEPFTNKSAAALADFAFIEMRKELGAIKH